ncbi:MAG: nicotinamide-nucleotide amidohydrolase family protein [Candidatus Lokiarchaeota archaeon]|nr:nicotinamide-nucleotide amidohydrolase family protein [Candidatus Lokiarchaeota archaeon]
MNELEILSKEVIQLFIKKNWRFCLVETSTGGFVADSLTNHDGSSRAFAGSLVLYSALAKKVILGVPMDFIQSEGQVSKKMIEKLLESSERFPVDVTVAVTGVAGNSIEGLPRGVTFIGINILGKTKIRKYTFSGTRREIKYQTAVEVMKLLIELLE